MDDAAPGRLKSMLRDGHADVVLSDMAAPGQRATPAPTTCASWGWPRRRPISPARCSSRRGLLVKVFQGGTERELLDLLKKRFTTVSHVKPPASRADSAELYVIATGFRPA